MRIECKQRKPDGVAVIDRNLCTGCGLCRQLCKSGAIMEESNNMETKGILMAGVGGQGILRASDILCRVFMAAGLDVKKSEVHGMAQRGGCVTSHVRYGTKVYSPLAKKRMSIFLFLLKKWTHCVIWIILRKRGLLSSIQRKSTLLPSIWGKRLIRQISLRWSSAYFLKVKVVDAAALALRPGISAPSIRSFSGRFPPV